MSDIWVWVVVLVEMLGGCLDELSDVLEDLGEILKYGFVVSYGSVI